MSDLNVDTLSFSAYQYAAGDWVQWKRNDSEVYGKVRDRTKRSFELDGTTISGDQAENVYKIETYSSDTGEFSEKPTAKPESDLDQWGGPQNASSESETALNDAKLSFAATAISPQQKEIATEFNEHGIRKNTDEDGNLVSVDAVFEAMEPGPPENRNGVRITKDFLKKIAAKDYSDDPPYLMDHTKKTLSQIGFVKDVWFNESQEKLMVMARAYNTGSQTHDEFIKRLTFEPPTITDGSVGLGDNYEAVENEDGELELLDGKIREFSSTPFPGGYDDGGLKTKYSDSESSEADVFIVVS